ncbi:hypothetical protein ACTND3_10805, partial [Bacillota bacterium HCP28S3_F12]
FLIRCCVYIQFFAPPKDGLFVMPVGIPYPLPFCFKLSPPFASAKAGDTVFFPFRHYYGLHHAFWQTRRKIFEKYFKKNPCAAPPVSSLLCEG